MGKGVEHRLVMAQVGHQAQLNLGIVSAEEHVAVGRNERAAYLFALVVPDRDVLQVGIGR